MLLRFNSLFLLLLGSIPLYNYAKFIYFPVDRHLTYFQFEIFLILKKVSSCIVRVYISFYFKAFMY